MGGQRLGGRPDLLRRHHHAHRRRRPILRRPCGSPGKCSLRLHQRQPAARLQPDDLGLDPAAGWAWGGLSRRRSVVGPGRGPGRRRHPTGAAARRRLRREATAGRPERAPGQPAPIQEPPGRGGRDARGLSPKGTLGTTDVQQVASGGRTIRKLFSKEQRAFLSAYAPDGIELDDLSMLGPINLLKLKFSPEGSGRRLVADLWMYPDGSRILELSTKCAPAAGFDVAAGQGPSCPAGTSTCTASSRPTPRPSSSPGTGTIEERGVIVTTQAPLDGVKRTRVLVVGGALAGIRRPARVATTAGRG
jgi:hypothetical protein